MVNKNKLLYGVVWLFGGYLFFFFDRCVVSIGGVGCAGPLVNSSLYVTVAYIIAGLIGYFLIFKRK